jgi:hypothetical protein
MISKECKRLAEEDFPIAEVSRHSAREKSIQPRYPSTPDLWWARRPLAPWLSRADLQSGSRLGVASKSSCLLVIILGKRSRSRLGAYLDRARPARWKSLKVVRPHS